MNSVSTKELLAAAALCEQAADSADVQVHRRAMLEVFAHREQIQVGLMLQQMQSLSQAPHRQERLPLRESGDDIGIVESRIPKEIFFNLLKQKGFGYEGLCDEGEMRQFLKANPAFAVKTVSGKTTVGWRQARNGKRGVTFGRGTLVLAT